MITVEKVGNDTFPDIRISDGSKSFMIARNNLPDLVWYPEEVRSFTNSDDITFTIREEEGDIFTLFEKFYSDVIDGNLFPLTNDKLKGKTETEITELVKEKAKEKRQYRKLAKDRGLVRNGIICWHSDNYDQYEYAAVLTIKKVGKQIEIIFSRNNQNLESSQMWIPSHYVRICESGSRYQLFYVIFAQFYRQLQLLDWAPPILESNLNNNLQP